MHLPLASSIMSTGGTTLIRREFSALSSGRMQGRWRMARRFSIWWPATQGQHASFARRSAAVSWPMNPLPRWTESLDAPDQIAKVVRGIALSEEFASAEPRKLKRPFEFLASLYRATEAEVASPTLNFHWDLIKCGWNQHECRPPTGHADVSDYWANTNLVAGFTNLAVNALEDGYEAGKAELSKALPEKIKTLEEAARYWTARLQHGEPSNETVAATRAIFTDDPAATLSEDPNEREWALRQMVAIAALSPQFLFR
jgi:Protein of unknown function (DUF1800)